MPWYIYLALKQLFPSGRRLPSFFFLVSATGVMLGVAVLVVVQSVMGGFGHMHREKMILTSGHLDVRAGGNVIYNGDALMSKIDQYELVEAAVPYAQGIVMLTHNNRSAFPFIFGVDLFRKKQVVPLADLIISGDVKDLDDDSVLLSITLANNLQARAGSVVEVYTPLMIEKLKQDEVLLPRELIVAGIYETGWAPFDSTTMVTTLRLAQDLYELEGGIHGVSVRLETDNDDVIFDMANRMDAELPPPARVSTWMELNRDFLWILALEKNMMLFLLLFIVIVAAFAIAVAQLMTVLRKTREIGLLGALGARPMQLAAGYCFQGFLIGVVGAVLGISLAVSMLHFRNPVIEMLATLTQSKAALVHFYQFAELPVHYAAKDFIVITTATLVIATLAGLIPAYRAARMRPAEALRSE